MKLRRICLITAICSIFSVCELAGAQEMEIIGKIEEANLTENLLRNHDNFQVTYIQYNENGSIEGAYSFLIDQDFFFRKDLTENTEIYDEIPQYFIFSDSLLDYGAGEFVEVVEQKDCLEMIQKKAEEVREYILFTLSLTNHEIQKIEHWSPKQDGEMGKVAEMSVQYDVEDYLEEEIVCYEFLNTFFNVTVAEAQKFFSDWEKEAQEITEKAAEAEMGIGSMIHYDSTVLEELLEEKFRMLNDTVAEKMTKNRSVLWAYKKSYEKNEDMELYNWTIKKMGNLERYGYEVELRLGIDILNVSGTIGIIRESEECLVSEFTVHNIFAGE